MPPPIATPRSRALGFGLRKARKARGYGLRELARATGVHAAELSNWELGLRVPRIEEVAPARAAAGARRGARQAVRPGPHRARAELGRERDAGRARDPHDAGRV
ncbi:helix-turn-helix transcriptional regulator [Amycolatopsis sp. NPDC051716]|uniref:helix-turn-helix domain-containing protein n=1 Tax=Amycolatopsis sp. NPDC051716 TaxID=3155804 RepID=UPI003445AFBE